uniref:Ground-like domain-containing protein n=1 Tax=Parastrongyloides trichosuri TaxID=131310 RepID=A0A0N5A0F2_PARTI
MNYLYLLLLLIPPLDSCLFGGGGCGCGCLPKIPPPEFTCVSVPVLKLSLPSCSTPCCPPGPSFSPCMKRRKRNINHIEKDDDCTDNLLRQIIQQNIKNESLMSVYTISLAMKEIYGENHTFAVSCGPNKNFYYSTTIKNYCYNGNDKIFCTIFKYN